jgi:NADPH:quinone reductase-like Zn-dependent oxidoreductase
VLVAKVPENIPFSEACVLPTAFNTAIVSLCAPPGQGFGLQLPSLDPKPSGKTVVVWGASSSCGTLILQLARAAGIKAIAVASGHNHELCKSCGAVDALDYRKDSIVSDVVKSVESVGGEFVGIIDCVSVEDQSLKFCIPVLEQLSGGELGILLPHAHPKVPENVKLTKIFGVNDITHAFWKDYITPALKQGRLMCTPEPLVVGDGLESFQEALDVQRKGVSAKKVVVTL